MLSQYEFVEQCLIKYRWEQTPEDQIWHEAHYPIPECLGGTQTISLWVSDHAEQAIIQCEEFKYPCLFGWERKYVSGELLKLHSFWMSQKGVAVANWIKENTTPEERSKKAKEVYDRLDPEVRKRWHVCGNKALPYEVRLKAAINSHKNRTPESYAEVAKKNTISLLAKNPDHFSDIGKKARETESQKVRSARGHAIPQEARKRGSDKANSQKWMCLVTGHVSTAGPLTIWQKARSIDPSLRTKLND
jgi:hypothetical protein